MVSGITKKSSPMVFQGVRTVIRPDFAPTRLTTCKEGNCWNRVAT